MRREFVMWIWVALIVSGVCTFASFYMAFLAMRLDDNGAFLFSGFGLFFGIIFVISIIKAAAGKSVFLKRVDDKISGKPKPAVFVPHGFMMLALIIAGIVIVAAIFIPILFR